MAAVEGRGLTKRFGDFVAVQDLDLDVAQGEIYGFLGENGAGKSTTIRMLLGLIWPDDGEAFLNGLPVVPGSGKSLHGVGAIVEQPAFYPNLSALENLKSFALLSGGASRSNIDEKVQMLGLESFIEKPAGVLSHGQKQRLGIASALLPNNTLLILDEPQDGLDPTWVRRIRDILRLLSSRNITVLISSHRLNEIEQVCDRIGIIHKGQMLYQGEVGPLLAGEEFVSVRTSDKTRATNLLTEKGFDITDGNEGEWFQVRASDDDRAAEINRLLVNHNVQVIELMRNRLTLEDVFLKLTSEESSSSDSK